MGMDSPEFGVVLFEPKLYFGVVFAAGDRSSLLVFSGQYDRPGISILVSFHWTSLLLTRTYVVRAQILSGLIEVGICR